MKKYLFLLFGYLIPFLSSGQYYDANWISGAGYTGVPITPSNWISFQEYSFQLETFVGTMGLDRSNITLSDRKGNFLLYSNGNRVFNSKHEQIDNGDSLTWGELAEDFYDEGFPLPDGMVGIAIGRQDSVFYLIHSLAQYAVGFGANIPKTHYSMVDMRLNNGKGKIIEKNQILWNGIYIQGLSACLHGNGRDWWVTAFDDTLQIYYRALFTPEGLSHTDTQTISYHPPWFDSPNGGGQNVFTPNGRKYVDFDAWNGIRIFDFDRCSGLLSNPILIEFPQQWSFGAGAAVSPNSRFLYVSSSSWIIQYDLSATDIAASADTVMVWHGTYPKFARMNLMMDGKIYIMPSSWTHYGHYIRYPNRKGKACEVVLGGVYFPNENSATMPNFPSYRLGPLESSPCDTLGLQPLPLAWWRWDRDTTELQLAFTDHSSYEPQSWHWDFGDGATSSDTCPVHQYALPGTYQVCMIVCNAYGCDTMCRQVEIHLSGTGQPPLMEQRMELYPNPAADFVVLRYNGVPGQAEYRLMDILGRPVLESRLTREQEKIDVSGLPNGVYFVQVGETGKTISSIKVIVAH